MHIIVMANSTLQVNCLLLMLAMRLEWCFLACHEDLIQARNALGWRIFKQVAHLKIVNNVMALQLICFNCQLMEPSLLSDISFIQLCLQLIAYEFDPNVMANLILPNSIELGLNMVTVNFRIFELSE